MSRLTHFRICTIVLMLLTSVSIFSACESEPDQILKPITPPAAPEVDSAPSVVSNRNPVIDLESSRSSSNGWGVGGYGSKEMTATVVCEAFDPDGDQLDFKWEVNAGSLIGQGRQVTWVVPAKPDDYIIKVVVTDNKGGSNTMILTNNLESVEITGGTCRTKGEWLWEIEK